ncbi:unknown [Prevotella sp. CAG:873]|nr:unknown [Prevotella sp. CAG:873]
MALNNAKGNGRTIYWTEKHKRHGTADKVRTS